MNFHLFPDNAKLQFRVLTPTEVGGSDIPGNDRKSYRGEPVYNARQKNLGNAGRKRVNTFFRGMDAAASGRVDKGKRRLHERKK